MEFKLYVTVDIDCPNSDSDFETAQITFDKAIDKFFETISNDFNYEVIDLEIK